MINSFNPLGMLYNSDKKLGVATSVKIYRFDIPTPWIILGVEDWGKVAVTLTEKGVYLVSGDNC